VTEPPVFLTRGVVLVTRDIETLDWPTRAKAAGLTTIATHIFPQEIVDFLATEPGQRFLQQCRDLGLLRRFDPLHDPAIINDTNYPNGHCNGDGFLFYPDPEGKDLPYSSMRLEITRDAFEDYDLLTLLERQGGEIPREPTPSPLGCRRRPAGYLMARSGRGRGRWVCGPRRDALRTGGQAVATRGTGLHEAPRSQVAWVA
jgi:hypothetical protein